MALPVRKKPFELDGAKFTIAPLTYDEMEEYSRRVKETNEKRIALKLEDDQPIPEDLRKEMRLNAFYLICRGLNNAGAEPEITPTILAAEIDDVLGAALATEILQFNGLKVPSGVELANRLRNPEGETPASS